MKKLLFFIVALLLFTVPPVFAASKYIRAGAAGTGTGDSWTNAYPDFSGFTWTRGNTYYVAGGTYARSATITITPAGTTPLYIKKANTTDNGAEGDWDGNYATNQAVIDSSATYVFSLGGYIDINGVTGSGSSSRGIKIYGSSLSNAILSFSGASHVTLQNLEICGVDSTSNKKYGVYWASTAASEAHGFHLQNCYLHHIGGNGITTGNSVGANYSDYGFLLEDNVLDVIGIGYLGDSGFHTQGIQIAYAATDAYTIIRNNVFTNIVSQGSISFLGGGSSHSNARIYNNLFYSTAPSTYNAADILYIHESSTTVDSILFYNKTAYNLGGYSSNVRNDVPGATNVEVKNNLWIGCNFATFHLNIDASSSNGYYNNSGAGDPGDTEADDPFINSAGYDFRIETDSVAHDGGTDLSAIFTTDIIGSTRPLGSAFDIGAYEFIEGGEGDVTPPAMAAFVVPATAESLTVAFSTPPAATDAVGVTGYLVNESAAPPLAADEGWVGSAPTTYTFTTWGAKTLYAWAKDAAGNVSSSINDSVTLTASGDISISVTGDCVTSPSITHTPTAGTVDNLYIVANPGSKIDAVSGCGGTWTASPYVTATITEDCTETVVCSKIQVFPGVNP
jgi:hypothetical protein